MNDDYTIYQKTIAILSGVYHWHELKAVGTFEFSL